MIAAGGGSSVANITGVAPSTAPIVALSLTSNSTLRLKRSTPATLARGPMTTRGGALLVRAAE